MFTIIQGWFIIIIMIVIHMFEGIPRVQTKPTPVNWWPSGTVRDFRSG